MEKNFSFETEESGSVVVIRAEGYLNDAAAEGLREEFRYHMDEMTKNRFVVNFEKTESINSLGISVLLDIIDWIVTEHGGAIAFCTLAETTRTTLKMMGIFQDVQYFETESEAITALASA